MKNKQDWEKLEKLKTEIAELKKEEKMNKYISKFHKEMLKNGWHLHRVDKVREIIEYHMYLLTLTYAYSFTFKSIENYGIETKEIVKNTTEKAVVGLGISLLEKLK